MSIISGEEADRLYEMERLVKVWRDIVRSMLSDPLSKLPALRDAENRLYEFTEREIA